jgi:hypothetical protein
MSPVLVRLSLSTDCFMILFHSWNYSVDNILCVFCIKGSKRVSVNILDFYPGEDSEDGLDEEGHEEECLSVHHGHHHHCHKSDNL